MAGPHLDVGGVERDAVVANNGALDIGGANRDVVATRIGYFDVGGLNEDVVAARPGALDVGFVTRDVVTAISFVGAGQVQGRASVTAIPGHNATGAGLIEGGASVRAVSQAFINFPSGIPGGPTTLLNTIRAYLYWQYNDDPDVQSMVDAYNAYSQAYVDWFNALNLPVYTGENITGALLDWVGTNLYGLSRPAIPYGGVIGEGPFNTYEFNSLPFNGWVVGSSGTEVVANDDVYKRCLTWQIYKGDGFQFSIPWLKRRVFRWIYGKNGVSPIISDTYGISVQFPSRRTGVITVPATSLSATFQAAVDAGVLPLPFTTAWSVEIA